MNDLDFFVAKKPGGPRNQRKLQRPERQGKEGDAEILGDTGKLAARGSAQPYLVAQLKEGMGDADRAVICASPE
jgi:hypothetical protein